MKRLLLGLLIACCLSLSIFAGCSGEPGAKHAFRQLTPAQKAEVWKKHLVFSANTEDLNTEQLRIIADVYRAINASLFTEGNDKSVLTDFVVRIKENFSVEQGTKIFFELTTAEAKGFKLVPIAYKLAKAPFYMPDCDCNYDQGSFGCTECKMYYQPYGSHIVCTDYPSGCGILWDFPCSGAACNNVTPTEYCPTCQSVMLRLYE